MSESFDIALDMIDQKKSEAMGGTVVGIRDMLIALGLSDDELREHDRVCQLRDDILSREPWRDARQWRKCGVGPNGMEVGYMEGRIDWSGTEMQEIEERRIAKERSRPRTVGRKVDWYWVREVQEWDGDKWAVTRHADNCECPECIV